MKTVKPKPLSDKQQEMVDKLQRYSKENPYIPKGESDILVIQALTRRGLLKSRILTVKCDFNDGTAKRPGFWLKERECPQ